MFFYFEEEEKAFLLSWECTSSSYIHVSYLNFPQTVLLTSFIAIIAHNHLFVSSLFFFPLISRNESRNEVVIRSTRLFFLKVPLHMLCICRYSSGIQTSSSENSFRTSSSSTTIYIIGSFQIIYSRIILYKLKET